MDILANQNHESDDKSSQIPDDFQNTNQNSKGVRTTDQKCNLPEDTNEQSLSPNQTENVKPETSDMFEYMQFEEGAEDESKKNEASLQPFTWKGKMRNFLHSKPCHVAVIVLVLIDTALVITEILLDLHIVEVGEESRAPEIVHYCSISVLSIFMIEIAAKLVADWHHFWSHKMEILDGIVVVVAFGFDIGLLFVENEALIAIELLVLLRLWRIVRIVNGIVLTAKNKADDRAHMLKDRLKVVEDEKIQLEEKVAKQESEIKRLREILHENGIHIEDEPLGGDGETKGEAVIEIHSDNMISIDT